MNEIELFVRLMGYLLGIGAGLVAVTGVVYKALEVFGVIEKE